MEDICYYSKLPEDMQILISDILELSHCKLSKSEINELQFKVDMLPIDIFPEVPMWTDYRHQSYANAMIGQALPPIIICDDQWIDGRNRIWALRKANAAHVPVIDLFGLIDSYPFPPIALLSRR